MSAIVDVYSKNKVDIKKFIDNYFGSDIKISNNFNWKHEYQNPLELVDIISCYIDNNDKYEINMWVSFDEDFFINVTDKNADKIIRYLFERYPY